MFLVIFPCHGVPCSLYMRSPGVILLHHPSNEPSADSSEQFQLGGSGDLEQVGLATCPSALWGCTRGPQHHPLHGP